ncbi:hypothetical protein Acr_23g0009430 [Actinidia rufa]|uniref:Uncharacterized protein n=1 Tax=Actinidia rufa TaxID=165716 RepID=A0A7J0GP91_9ERIC|nr:hypothetical protein Acr_23g0009430 [Actinidia rufa]
MGIMKFINATTDKVKQNAPDLTYVKGACRSTYGYGCATVAKVVNAVRIMEFINATTDKVKQNAPDLTSVNCACRSTYDYGWTTVAKLDNAVRENVVPTLNPYLPDDEGWAKIGRFAKNTAEFAFQEGIKRFPGGSQLYKFVKEELKDQPSSFNPKENKKPDLTVVMEEMQAKMEKMQEDMNNIKQQSKVPIQSAKESEPLRELPNEPAKGPAPQKAYPKNVFIRSRL